MECGIPGEFEDVAIFSPRFQRNNKKGGLKNLRCFPTCSAMHRERGFCGRMVVVGIAPPSPGPGYQMFGEFVSFAPAVTGSARPTVQQQALHLAIGEKVNAKELMALVRDKANPTKPWMEADKLDANRFAFNRDKKGWHYGWASNKHTCNASHVLQAYLFEPVGGDVLQVRGIYQSPHFTLFCRRRRRFAMVPSAPIAPPNAKKPESKRMRQTAIVEDEEEEEEEDEEEDEDDQDDVQQLTISPVERVERMLRAFSHRIANVNTRFSKPAHATESQFSHELFECIDFFAEETNLLGGDEAEETTTDAGELDMDVQLIDDLLAFFLEDNDFSLALTQFYASSSSTDFAKFVELMSDHLTRFLSCRSMPPSQFDALLPKLAQTDLLAQKTFQTIFLPEDEATPEAPVAPLPYYSHSMEPEQIPSCPELERMQGVWVQEAQENTIEQLRESMGYPWMLRKMLSFMEGKFEVQCENQLLLVRLQRRLFASGAMRIVLDGEEHVWGMKMPMFEAISNSWKYRAWVDDVGVVHHVHETGFQSRMRRQMFVNELDQLVIHVALEELCAVTQTWAVVTHAVQYAKRSC